MSPLALIFIPAETPKARRSTDRHLDRRPLPDSYAAPPVVTAAEVICGSRSGERSWSDGGRRKTIRLVIADDELRTKVPGTSRSVLPGLIAPVRWRRCSTA
jgi:hypothetical protein